MNSLSFAARLLTLAAILVVGGVVVFRRFVLAPARLGDANAEDVERRIATLGVFAALLLIPAAAARLVVQVDGMRYPEDPWLPMARTMVTATTWGAAWIAQLAAAVALVFVFLLARRRRRWPWTWATVLALVLCATPSVASHAAAARRFGGTAIASDMLHVAAAATWLGTLVVLVVAVGSRVSRLLPFVRAFSPVALTAATLVALSGAVSSFAHIAALSEFVSTLYGRMVLLKVASVLVVAACGFVNWRILTPNGTSNPRALWRGTLVESAAAVLVLVITAFLIVTPPPAE